MNINYQLLKTKKLLELKTRDILHFYRTQKLFCYYIKLLFYTSALFVHNFYISTTIFGVPTRSLVVPNLDKCVSDNLNYLGRLPHNSRRNLKDGLAYNVEFI